MSRGVLGSYDNIESYDNSGPHHVPETADLGFPGPSSPSPELTVNKPTQRAKQLVKSPSKNKLTVDNSIQLDVPAPGSAIGSDPAAGSDSGINRVDWVRQVLVGLGKTYGEDSTFLATMNFIRGLRQPFEPDNDIGKAAPCIY